VAVGREFHQKEVEKQKNQGEMANWQVGKTIIAA